MEGAQLELASRRQLQQRHRDIILEYLVFTGQGAAVEAFLVETHSEGSLPRCKLGASLPLRSRIRSLILRARVLEAVEALNDFDCDILDDNASLFYELCLHHLIHCFQRGSDEEVRAFVDFAAKELVPVPASHLPVFEAAMSLLLFPADAAPPPLFLSQFGSLGELADKVNLAVLHKVQGAYVVEPDLSGLSALD
jgi:hypothetical protein